MSRLLIKTSFTSDNFSSEAGPGFSGRKSIEIGKGLRFSETICVLHENVNNADQIICFLHRYIEDLTADGVITPPLSNNVLARFELPVIYC